jgi:hypothetical protein
MYTRNVSIKLKANGEAEFTRILEKEVIPVLRKQKGFKDEITLVAPERYEAREKYAEVLKILSKVVEGVPKVESFEVANSTSHQIAAKAA